VKSPFDLTLYLVTDPSAGEKTETIVKEAVAGGVTMVQLREKTAGSLSFYERALRLKRVTREAGVPLIINDRTDIMLAADADGLHVGQSDLPAAVARRLIGPDKILGVSAHTVEEAVRAEKDGADYLGVGAVFPTATKKDAESVSYETLKEICETVSIPVVAIGGIGEKNIGKLAGSGIRGIAVVSAIMNAENPEKQSHILKNEINQIL
jgi:thiamine-phosphate pyrophosphorylase